VKNAEREPLSIDEIGDRLVAEFKKLTPEQREQSFEIDGKTAGGCRFENAWK
jgi:hypothetical protein